MATSYHVTVYDSYILTLCAEASSEKRYSLRGFTTIKTTCQNAILSPQTKCMAHLCTGIEPTTGYLDVTPRTSKSTCARVFKWTAGAVSKSSQEYL